jgi:alpha-glucosidase
VGRCLLLALCATAGQAQDERLLASPSGQVVFRLFVAQPEPGGLPRLAYQLRYRGRLVLDTSYLGLEIRDQEPLLGENAGLTAWTSAASRDGRYRTMTAEYMQNGSLGRRINVEVRAYNTGVAFRYIVPPSTPLDELLIQDEVTEFAFSPRNPVISRMRENVPIPLPFATEAAPGRPGAPVWVEITEAARGRFQPMHLVRFGDGVLISRLARNAGDPTVVFEGKPPLTCPWRVVIVGPTHESLGGADFVNDLSLR